jgi:hypothetical protein
MDTGFQKCPDGRFSVTKTILGMTRVLGYVGEDTDGSWSAWLLKEDKEERVSKKFASQDEAGLFVYENSK